MTDKFRVALSGDFRKADGSPTYPDFDLAPLYSAKDVEVVFLEAANPLRADQLEDFDALISCSPIASPQRASPGTDASALWRASASAMTLWTSTPARGRVLRL